MKTLFVSIITLITMSSAMAAEETVLSVAMPRTKGPAFVNTKFVIDSEMKEAYAQVKVEDKETIMVRRCGGFGGNPGSPRLGSNCRTVPEVFYRTVLSEKIKLKDITMNGDEVIYQGAEGDVVCGKMKPSRFLKIPTFYLSGKCDLDGKIVIEDGMKKIKVTFKTK